MLKVTDLTVHYGAIQALRGISFDVNQGEIITLIGSNGNLCNLRMKNWIVAF